uniref:Uncharacterized protein n=1 Tax=Ciona savignyi TaxID=51511 RepID=H2YGP0_CIOSA
MFCAYKMKLKGMYTCVTRRVESDGAYEQNEPKILSGKKAQKPTKKRPKWQSLSKTSTTKNGSTNSDPESPSTPPPTIESPPPAVKSRLYGRKSKKASNSPPRSPTSIFDRSA